MSERDERTSCPDDRVLDELKRMSATEVAKSAVSAGIYTKDGKLTQHYRAPSEKKARK